MQAGSRDAPHFFVFSYLTMPNSTIPTSGLGHVPPSVTPSSTQGPPNATPLTHAYYGPVNFHPSVAATSHAPTAQMLATNVNPLAVVSQPPSSGSQPPGKLTLQLLTSTKEYVIPASITTTKGNPSDSFDTAAFIEELRLVEQRTPKSLGAAVLGGQTLVKVKYVLSSAPDVVATLHLTPDDKLHSAKIRSILWDIKTWRKVTFDVGAAASTSGVVPSSRARTPPAVNNPRPPQRPRIDAGTTTTSTSLPSSTTGSSTPATASTVWRGCVGLDLLERSRDAAFQHLLAVLPPQLNQLPLAAAEFTLITRQDFTVEEETQWRQNYRSDTRPEQDQGRYYRISLPGNTFMIDETPLTTNRLQKWQTLRDDAADTVAAVAFFAGMGSSPTSQDGANYFHLNQNAWIGAQPLHTNPVDANHAFLLSNVMGEPIATSQFAALDAYKQDPLKQMAAVAQTALGARTKVAQFNIQKAFVAALALNTHSRMVIEYHGIGQGGPQYLLLQRHGQQPWRIFSPGNGWEPPPLGENLATIGEHLWKNSGRDQNMPIRILSSSGPDDATFFGLRRRLRAAYHTMQDHTMHGVASQIPPAPASPTTSVRNTSIARIVRDEHGFETNDSVIQRLNKETRRISNENRLSPAFPHFRELADALSLRPSRPRTFDELHRTGALEEEFRKFLSNKYPRDADMQSQQLAGMNPLITLLETNILTPLMPADQPVLSRPQLHPPQPLLAFMQKMVDALARTYDKEKVVNPLQRLMGHIQAKMPPGTPSLESMNSEQFDSAVRHFLDTTYPDQRALPLPGQTRKFRDMAHFYARVSHVQFSDSARPTHDMAKELLHKYRLASPSS